MCNRYRMTAHQFDVARALSIPLPFDEFPNRPPPDLVPKKSAWVAREREGRRILDVMSWGFPHMVRSPKTGRLSEKPVTNDRNLASRFWRSALTNPEHRCLIAVSSFSECGPGVPGKLPLYWFDLPSRPVFAFAGIWRPLGDGAAFAFLTCDPNPLVAPIHPQAMPVILHDHDDDRWLTCDYAEAVTMAAPYPSQLMTVKCSTPTLSAGEIEADDQQPTGLLDVITD